MAQSWLVNMHIAIVSIAKCILGTCVLSAATTQQQKRPTRHVRLTIQSEGADDDDESLH